MLLGTAGFGLSELLLAPRTSIGLACVLLFVAGICFTTWTSNTNSLSSWPRPITCAVA